MCSVRSSVAPRRPLFHFVTSDLLKQLWKHNCSLWLSLLLCSQLSSPPIHSLQAGTNGCFGTLCACVRVLCVCVMGVRGCLIVLRVINCCDSRNVCVTSSPRLESISCLFWVSLAGYHSNTHKCSHTLLMHILKHLHTHTHTLASAQVNAPYVWLHILLWLCEQKKKYWVWQWQFYCGVSFCRLSGFGLQVLFYLSCSDFSHSSAANPPPLIGLVNVIFGINTMC